MDERSRAPPAADAPAERTFTCAAEPTTCRSPGNRMAAPDNAERTPALAGAERTATDLRHGERAAANAPAQPTTGYLPTPRLAAHNGMGRATGGVERATADFRASRTAANAEASRTAADLGIERATSVVGIERAAAAVRAERTTANVRASRTAANAGASRTAADLRIQRTTATAPDLGSTIHGRTAAVRTE